jgi:hypothetical protein
MAKPNAAIVQKANPDLAQGVVLAFPVNRLEIEHLERLRATGFWGKTLEETAHRLLDEALAARCL